MTLLERLRHVQHFGRSGLGMRDLVRDAADEITRLTAELAAVKEESAETRRKLLEDNHRLEAVNAELQTKFAEARELLRRVKRDSEVRETRNFTPYFVSYIDEPTMYKIHGMLAKIDGKGE
jgi:septal ring factor EnvC (AmiA/AmiB activator)